MTEPVGNKQKNKTPRVRVVFEGDAFARVKLIHFPENEKRTEEVESLRRTLLSPTINLPILKVENQEDVLPVLSLYAQKEREKGLDSPIFRIVSIKDFGIDSADDDTFQLNDKIRLTMEMASNIFALERSIPVFVSISDYEENDIEELFKKNFLSQGKKAIILLTKDDEKNGYLPFLQEEIQTISGLKNVQYPFEREGLSRGRVQEISPMTDAEKETYLTYNLLKMARLNGFYFYPHMSSYLTNESIKRFPKDTVMRKTFEVLDYAMGLSKVEGKKSITRSKINKAFENIAPLHDRMKALIDMDKRLKQKIFGQDEAIDNVYNLILSKCDEETEKPTILGFFGPSGVGKTALAEEISMVLTGKKVNCINMAEYADDFKMSILIGSSKGYVDSDQDGLLAQIIKENPRAVILLDEFEKAHPKVQRMFLGMFDKGSLYDNHSGEMDFSEATIILTSNAGVCQQKSLGFTADSDVKYSANIDLIKEEFPPELLGRIDAKIMFNPLSRSALGSILNKFMVPLDERFKKLGIDVSLSDEAKNELIEMGQDPSAGARPLMTVLKQRVKTPIEIAFFKKEIKAGDKVVIQSIEKEKDFKILRFI